MMDLPNEVKVIGIYVVLSTLKSLLRAVITALKAKFGDGVSPDDDK